MESITIIIPVKDEEDGLRYLLGDYQSSSISNMYNISFIFVIDERTCDSSKETASKFSEKVIDQMGTTGKGAAVIQAVSNWKKDPSDFVVFLDADGSYSFDSVIKIVSELEKGTDVASGTRFLKSKGRPQGMTRFHYFGNRFLSLVSSIRNRRKISDLCTGLWGFRKDALMTLKIQSSGFDLEAEISGLVRKNSLKHTEVQVEWGQRKGGVSKLRSLTDGFIILTRIIRT
jgi:dolichol-phosphate mannosyltransferase